MTEPPTTVPVAEQLPLRGGLTLSRDRYFEVQAAAEALFGQPDLTLPAKVAGVHQLVLRLSRGQPLPSAEELRAAIRLASQGGSEHKARLVMGIFLSTALPYSGNIIPQGGFGLMMTMLAGVAKQAAGIGSVTIGRWGVTVGVAAVQTVNVAPVQAVADERLATFWREQVAAGWLLRYGTLFRGAGLLAIGTGLAQWLLRAAAVAAGRPPDDADLERALEFLREEMVRPGAGFRLALEGTFSAVFDSLLDSPALVASLAGFAR